MTVRWLMLVVLAGCEARTLTTSLARPIVPQFRASCVATELDVCTEHTDGSIVLGEESVRAACLASKGRWSPARCPSEGRVGVCEVGSTRRSYYADEHLHFTSVTAARDCVELYQGSFIAR